MGENLLLIRFRKQAPACLVQLRSIFSGFGVWRPAVAWKIWQPDLTWKSNLWSIAKHREASFNHSAACATYPHSQSRLLGSPKTSRPSAPWVCQAPRKGHDMSWSVGNTNEYAEKDVTFTNWDRARQFKYQEIVCGSRCPNNRSWKG